MKYTVLITDTRTHAAIVDADSEDEAIQKAQELGQDCTHDYHHVDYYRPRLTFTVKTCSVCKSTPDDEETRS